MTRHAFSFRRFQAIVAKEFIQMRRDRLTFGMMIGKIVPYIAVGYLSNAIAKPSIEVGTKAPSESVRIRHAAAAPGQFTG